MPVRRFVPPAHLAPAASAVRADAPARPEPAASREPLAALAPSVPFAPFELAVEMPPPRRTRTIQLRVEDKEVFDSLQAWWFYETGQRLPQWEVFTLVLADALENPSGRFVRAGFAS